MRCSGHSLRCRRCSAWWGHSRWLPGRSFPPACLPCSSTLLAAALLCAEVCQPAGSRGFRSSCATPKTQQPLCTPTPQMDQRFAAAQAEARQLEGPSSSGQELLQKQQTQDGRCGYRWQRSYERSSARGSKTHVREEACAGPAACWPQRCLDWHSPAAHTPAHLHMLLALPKAGML